MSGFYRFGEPGSDTERDSLRSQLEAAQQKLDKLVHPTLPESDAEGSAASRNSIARHSFMEYCLRFPEQRFWQALRNWSGVRFLFARTEGDCFAGNLIDTFHYEGGELPALPRDVKLEKAGVDQAQEILELRGQLEAVTKALKDQPCRCRCLTHGFGCGIEEATCRKDRTYKCRRCAAVAKIEGKP